MVIKWTGKNDWFLLKLDKKEDELTNYAIALIIYFDTLVGNFQSKKISETMSSLVLVK